MLRMVPLPIWRWGGYRLDDRRLHDDWSLRGDKAEPRPVRRLERRPHRLGLARVHLQAGIAPLVPQRRPPLQLDALHPLPLQSRLRFPGQLRQHILQSLAADAALPQLDPVGQPHSIGRKHPRQRVDHHPFHAERVGDEAGMLAAGAAEAGQGVAGDVVAARDRDSLDRARHIVDGDPNEPRRGLDRRHPRLGADRLAQRQRRRAVDRPVAAGSEDPGKMLRPDLAEDDVAVGDRERAAAAVAGRAGHRSGAVRADPEPSPVIMADRAAARSDGVDLEHRRAHPDSGDDCLVGPLVNPGMMRHVGRGAAHVEADHPVEPRLPSRPRHSDDSAGRAGEDRVLALEGGGVGEAAGRLHEEEARPASERRHHLVDVAAQDRRQIGVDHRGVAAPDQLDQRPDPVARRHLGEADLFRQRRQRRLVRGPAPAVHQDDRDRPISCLISAYKGGAGFLEIERAKYFALRAHPLVDLDDLLVKRFGQDDPAGEDVGPGLVADSERVAEAPR